MRVVSVEASRASFADGSLLSWPQPCLRLLPCYLVVQLFWGWDESVSGAFRVASTQKPQSGRVWNHPLYDALCYYFWNIHIHFINDICQCLSHAKAFKRSPGVTAIETEPERFPLWRHLNQKVDPSQATWTHCSKCPPQQRHRDFLLNSRICTGQELEQTCNLPPSPCDCWVTCKRSLKIQLCFSVEEWRLYALKPTRFIWVDAIKYPPPPNKQ